jgi:hypothetical protein
VRTTNLNAIRAFFTNELALMSKVFYDKKHISTLNATISPDVNLTVLNFSSNEEPNKKTRDDNHALNQHRAARDLRRAKTKYLP